MIRPASYSLQIISRSHFDFTARFFTEEGGDAVDFTHDTLLAELWDRQREIKHGQFLIDTTRSDEGIVTFSLTADETTSLPTTGVYDVKIIYADGREYYLLQGSFVVSRGYTDD